MVVIIMISLLAILAMPAMKTARDDRMTFDYARQMQALIHRAEVRAMSRGAAHLVIIDTSGGSRGRATLFEAVDSTPTAQNGPKPVSSCRGQRDNTGTFINHWAEAMAWAPGGSAPILSPLIEWVSLDGPGVEAQMNLSALITEQTAGTAATMAVCYTPGGTVYAAAGTSPTNAVNNMRAAAPYAGYFTVAIARHDSTNATIGLTRRVTVVGGAAPRLVSQ